jgi:hypothetical protein
MLFGHFNERAVNECTALRLNAFRFEHFEKLVEENFVKMGFLHLVGKEPNGLRVGNGVMGGNAEKVLKRFAVANKEFGHLVGEVVLRFEYDDFEHEEDIMVEKPKK